MTASARLDGRRLTGMPALHRECRREFGLPDFYGNNISALIDCLSGVRDNDGMSRFALAPGELLDITVTDAGLVRRQAPEVLAALEDVVEEVNLRHAETGAAPALRLLLR
ncbi:barstar family protein [Noviherbaspirillum soli]|uniref:barstar family protein n=1 Tax=Noviherbaspirillum soli TaxID=1064518 RepID=UPI00188B60FC|nr:barstar family protein [Noviherbaspirillum soli]